MLSLRRHVWTAGALALAALSLTAPPGSAGPTSCGIGPGWDLFATGSGTYYNPVADALASALDSSSGVAAADTSPTALSFKGVPLGSYRFDTVGTHETGSTDTIVARRGGAGAPPGASAVVPLELVALQLQADGLPALGLSTDLPLYVTLQEGTKSAGQLIVQFDEDCLGGSAQALFSVFFEVRLGSIDGISVYRNRLDLTTRPTPWGPRPPRTPFENCHEHTIRTGVHCTLGPPILIPGVNVNNSGGDFHFGGSAGFTGCGVGAGWDLFRTGTGTYYNPVADLLGDALSTELTQVSFKGVPLGSYTFGSLGERPTGSTDTIVERYGQVRSPGGVLQIELVALQLQANGLPALGLSADLPVFVTLQSQRGGAKSTGTLGVNFADCAQGQAQAQFTVHFDVRALSVTGPILLSSSLDLHSELSRWAAVPPEREIENCHPHTIRTGVHCTLGPPILIPEVNIANPEGDFYLGATTAGA